MFPIINYGHTDQINSNRPGETMSACSWKISDTTGNWYIKENHSLLEYDARGFGLDLTLRCITRD
jgi:hypothetical protein